MKKRFCSILMVLLFLSLTIYGINIKKINNFDTLRAKNQVNDLDNSEKLIVEESKNLEEKIGDNQMKLQVGEYIFTATLVDNSSSKALKEMLAKGSITINMRDYANMEKVGMLGTKLPRNDEQITTEPGDLILYQGNAFVIYYAQNSWNFTRIGKIDDITEKELKKALGTGDVVVTLFLD